MSCKEDVLFGKKKTHKEIHKKFIKKDFADERAPWARLTETGDGNRNAEKFF